MTKRLGGVAGPLAALIVICVVFTIFSGRFLTFGNFSIVLQQTAVNAILAAGATLVILLGGIDLSVGSLLALAGAMAAWALHKAGIPSGIAIGLLVGLSGGLFNGLVIAYGRVAPFIVTLGTMTILYSLTLAFTHGDPISNFPDAFQRIGMGDVFHVPVSVLIAAAMLLLCHILLRNTRFGRYIYAIGGNEEAARLSGINVRLHKALVYMLAGCLTAVGAIVYMARMNSAQPDAGSGMELDAIAAVVIGGTSLSGGQGGIAGTAVGALIMQTLRSGLTQVGVPGVWHQAFIGAVIIIAVLVDKLRKRAA